MRKLCSWACMVSSVVSGWYRYSCCLCHLGESIIQPQILFVKEELKDHGFAVHLSANARRVERMCSGLRRGGVENFYG
jgi:hypothetical protein